MTTNDNFVLLTKSEFIVTLMKINLTAFFLVFFSISLWAQDEKQVSFDISPGYALQNFYDRGQTGVPIAAGGFSLRLNYMRSKQVTHSFMIDGAYFPDISFKQTKLGIGYFLNLNYQFIRNKPVYRNNVFQLSIGGFAGCVGNVKYFETLDNNKFSYLVSFFQAGPLVRVTVPLKPAGVAKQKQLSWLVSIPVASFTASSSYSSLGQPNGFGIVSLNKRIYLSSEIVLQKSGSKRGLNFGYRWDYEHSTEINNLSVWGMHRLFITVFFSKTKTKTNE